MAALAPPSPEYMELESDNDNGVSPSENPSQCTSRGAKLKSNVWDHMTRDNKDSGATAICNHCKQVFSARGKDGTSHLRRHINKCPKRRSHDLKNFLIASGSSIGTNSMTMKKPIASFDEIREAICVFIVSLGLPFSVVESRGFKNLMNLAVPDFTVISRNTVKRDAISHYMDDKKLVCLELVNAPGRICFTTDNWRSENTDDEFMCITAHWIDTAWNLQKRIIKFAALTPPFDGASLSDEILLSLGEWKISHKVFSFTLDNASYNDTMIASLKTHLVRKQSLIHDGEFFQMRCCCHIINLVVQAGLKLIDEVVVKIRKVNVHLRHSIPKSKKFYEMATTSFGLKSTRKLRLDTPTRWNSTYTMLDSCIYFRDALDSFVGKDVDMKVYKLSEDDWEKVVELHSFLKIFYEVTTDFSASQTPTANIYFYGVWKLHVALIDVVDSGNLLLSAMASQMLLKFQKYWADYNLLLSCAFVLDPRYKLDAILYCYTKLFGEIYAKEMVTKIKDTLVDLLDEYKELIGSSVVDGSGMAVDNSVGGASSRSRKVSSKKPRDELLIFLSKKGKITSDKSELEVYLDEDNEDAALELDVLNFWKKRSAHRSPILSALARDILSIPISSVPSESAFSLGKKMITPCRSSLRATTIEAIACYEDWLRVKGFDGASMLKVGDNAPDVIENEDDASVILTNDLHNLSISM